MAFPSPEEVRHAFVGFHKSRKTDGESLDALLFGDQSDTLDMAIDPRDQARTNNAHRYEITHYQPTPYALIRSVLREIKPWRGDVIYDLGCGWGRIPLYGALTTDAKYTGVELCPDRVKAAQDAAARNGIVGAEFIAANVLDYDFGDGNVFYLFNPFSFETEEKVGERLNAIARHKRVRVVELHGGARHLDKSLWRSREPWQTKDFWHGMVTIHTSLYGRRNA